MSKGFQFGWRIAAIAVLCLLLWSVLSFSRGEVAEYLEIRSYGQSIEDYDHYLYDGEYIRMRDWLSFGNPQGEEFALYWDVADAYWYYELYEFWQLAAGEGRADGAAYGEKYRECLLHMYENSGEEARRYIRSFAGELLP